MTAEDTGTLLMVACCIAGMVFAGLVVEDEQPCCSCACTE